MAKMMSDGLARLQNQSRIPASTWRQWCSLLKLDPIDAVDVWEEICYPIMVATRKVPEVPFILQMRAARLELDIFDFRDEAPKLLHIITFLYALRDIRLTGGKIKNSLLKFYKKSATSSPVGQNHTLFIQQFLKDLCSAILVAKVLPAANITLSGVLKPIVEGRGPVKQVIRLGLKVLEEKPFANVVRDCLNSPDLVQAAAAPPVAASAPADAAIDDDDYDDDDDDYDDDDYDDEEEEEEEEEGEDDDDYDDEDDDDDDDDYDDDEEEEGGDDDDEEEEGGDDDDDEEEIEGDSFDVFMIRFRTALHAIYEAEAKVDSDDDDAYDKAQELFEERLKAITLFKPLQASIPSIEEAQMLARRMEASRNATRIHKPTLGGGGSRSSAAGGSSAAAASSGGSAPKGMTGADRAAMIVKGEGQKAESRPSAPVMTPPAMGGDDLIETGGVGEEGIGVAAADMVEPEEINLPQFNDKVLQVGRLLAAIEPLDQTVWSLFLDPFANLRDCRALSRTLGSSGTGAQNAYQAIKQIARCLPLKRLLHISEQVVRKDRNFMLEVTGFINNVKNNRKFEPDSRQLAPLPHILDNAVCALIRLEGLKTNFKFANEYPEEYTRESVTLYYEEALRALTDLSNSQVRNQARQKADGDTNILIELFEAEKFVEQMTATVRTYAVSLRDAGGCESVESLKGVIAERPLEFQDAEAVNSEEVPPQLLVSDQLGEVFDEVCRYVIEQAWGVMQAVHRPEETVVRLKGVLREVMMNGLVVTPETRRHQERANIPLSVISLDKISGNQNLRDYYVRIGEDGRVAYLESFEDGSYVDLFELREYKPSRVHAAAKKEAEEKQAEELQTGRKYLFTVGRTNRLFGENPSDLINGCIRSEEGGPKIFPIF